ncbi:glycosyltransferase family 39 protein [Calothrix sp. NIES-2098]|uniref:glycosyltransferase family 39 protein n=1 Tax=Calothrix sp. NIES-2098 TaxID=1954171 RepID=UPI0030D864D8
MDEQLRTGSLLSIEDLHKYQYPNLEKNTIDTIRGLALEESQLTPLYFVMVRWWVELFGNSVAVTRSFSALISLLTFPCIYWLCQELFKSSLIGWLAIALVAISPVHYLYAQEARPYSLWIVTVLASSAALLRAMRLKKKVNWCIYTATLSLGFYTQLFFSLVAIAQGIYVFAIERFRLSKTFIIYLLSLLAGVLICIPWLLVMITNPTPPGMVNWTNTKQTVFASATRWAGIVSRAFLDLGISHSDSGKLKFALIPLILLVLALIIYSIYFLCRSSSKRVWLFVLTLIASIGLPLILVDFILGKRYGTTRYILPSILGIELAVAYLIGTKITSVDTNSWQKKLWSLVGFLVITSGVVSCTLSSQSKMWWDKLPELYQEYPKIADIINQANKPLVISDSEIISLQILSHSLDPKVRFQIVAQPQIPKKADGFTDIFLFKPSDSLKAGIEQVYTSKLNTLYPLLWKLTNKET